MSLADLVASHPGTHAIAALVALVAAIVFTVFVHNRVIRRRLLFSAMAAVAAGLVHGLSIGRPDIWIWAQHGWRIEQLILAVAAANGIVALLFNPWLRDGESDRAPAIVQDSLVAAVGIVALALIFDVSSFNFLTGSAIVAAVVGFALQDTLGNAFAGLAIQMERPFRVGHWIAVGEWAGLVTEVTWRSTKIRTKTGNVVAVPNSYLAGQAITNYSEPTAPTRIHADVGAAYGVPPNDVRDALLAAARGAAGVLATPAPDVVLVDFGASAILYRVRFWIDDFSRDELARDAVRTRIYYEFRRRNIEIPWPIQVEYQREAPRDDDGARLTAVRSAIANVPVLARLPEEAYASLASAARELLFADGESIVREGEPGSSMFLVLRGAVTVAIGAERRELALTQAGGYFGEMSLLTGEPRTATVVARGDCALLEIGVGAFRSYIQANPEVLDDLAFAATTRRRELSEARGAASGAALPPVASLRERMRAFFGIG